MSTAGSQQMRVGLPYRTRKEELTGRHEEIDPYAEGIRRAGGQPIEISLGLTAGELKKIAQTLDAILLPGSPADVEPSRYAAARHPNCGESDPDRERTDFALLEHAFAEHKPVLAICYGIQSLNVFLGGKLLQDIATETDTSIRHNWSGRGQGAPEPFHAIHLEAGTRLARMAGASEARVNSSHHQSILEPGRNLRIAARAPDGVIEAVESAGDANWVTGVQWHPERMAGADSAAQALFGGLVEAARKAPVPL